MQFGRITYRGFGHRAQLNKINKNNDDGNNNHNSKDFRSYSEQKILYTKKEDPKLDFVFQFRFFLNFLTVMTVEHSDKGTSRQRSGKGAIRKRF